GTVRYMAPEVVRGQPYNERVDVYSFGLLLWEMLAYQRVFEGIPLRQFYKSVITDGLRPEMEAHWSPALARLMKSCWAPNPDARPDIEAVAAALRVILAQVSLCHRRSGGPGGGGGGGN
ncbi:kinase-like domain-containing protein, partial [Tribonema minus]